MIVYFPVRFLKHGICGGGKVVHGTEKIDSILFLCEDVSGNRLCFEGVLCT